MSVPNLNVQAQAILLVLLKDVGAPHFGLEMARAAGLPSGSIYPILARLERAGWIESFLEDIDPQITRRRPRRYYKLSAEGERVATSGSARGDWDLAGLPSGTSRSEREQGGRVRRPGVVST